MNIYAVTRKGRNKNHSDDRIVIDDIVLNDESGLFENISPKIIGVSDGVGGNAGGDIAAQFICKRSSLLPNGDLLQNAADINTELLRYSSEVKGKEKMAATFSAIIFYGDTKILHIGNTRIYAIQGGYLKQLTNDQTTYNLLRFRGFNEEAENCNKSELVSCFGGGTDRLFSLEIVDMSVPKRFLMTSDGIHDHVDIDIIEEIISSKKSIREKSDELIQKAIDNGSYDDMSIVFAW